MSDSQRKDFMKKKIKRTGKTKESGSRISEEKVIIVTVLVAIVIMSGVLVWAMIQDPASSEHFSAMYILDAEKQANNYPQTVVLGTNSTFRLWVGVENQKGQTMEYSVQIKLDEGTSSHEPSLAEPLQVFNRTLVDEETWEFEVTLNIDQPGNNRILFELHYLNDLIDKWEYAWNTLDVSVEAIQP